MRHGLLEVSSIDARLPTRHTRLPASQDLAARIASGQTAETSSSYVADKTPIYLLVEESRIEEAVRPLIRVGLDNIVGYFTPETLNEFARTTGSLRRIRTIEMPELDKQRMGSDARVLDVRSDAEFEDGHVPGALHIPYTRIAVSATKLPVNTQLIVYVTAVLGRPLRFRC